MSTNETNLPIDIAAESQAPPPFNMSTSIPVTPKPTMIVSKKVEPKSNRNKHSDTKTFAPGDKTSLEGKSSATLMKDRTSSTIKRNNVRELPHS